MPPVQDKPDIEHLKQEALALATKPTKNFYDFACALWAAHNEDRTFLHEVERIAGIKRRALFYLSNVGRLLSEYRIDEAQAERIGWTKLQIVARDTARLPQKLNQRAMRANLQLALRTPSHALLEALERQGASSEGPTRSILLRLPAEQYADVEAALIACGAKRRGKGLVDKEEALVRLARSHLASAR
jgi:hypothetical protein